MTRELELLRAIAADPDDTGARRVYADWLIERGSPRGELIQLELALAEMDDFDDRRKATKARLEQLVREHAKAWLDPFDALCLPGVRFTLDRGIVGGVRGSSPALAAAAPKILASAPLVSCVAIEAGRERELAPLADSPLLPRIRSLVVSHYTPVRMTGWAALVLPEVRKVAWSSIAVGSDDVAALLAAPNAPNLAKLEISNCRLNRNALEPLAHARFPLRHLDMPAAKQGARLGELLGGNPAFANLVTLRIPGNELGSAGLAALRSALRNVESLDVRGCGLSAGDVAMLLDDAVLPAVRELWIGGQPLDDAVIDRLVAWPGAARLRKLHLGHAGIGDRASRALAACPQLAGLRSLVLSGSRLEPATEEALVASPHLAKARIYAGSRMLARTPPVKRKPKKR